MIVSKAGAWSVLRVTEADFWLVGDLNARFCPPALISKVAEGLTFTTQPGCDAGASSVDCTQDTPLKGFGL